MRILHHWPLDPWSRQVRLALAEKKLDFEVEYQRFWDGPDDLLALNPTGLPPVLVEETEKGRTALCETRAILEYLEETHPEPALLPGGPADRAEARRLAAWFDVKFSAEVNGRRLKGIDMVRFNEAGKIVEFEVMVRPMSGLQALGQEMGSRLASYLAAAKARA